MSATIRRFAAAIGLCAGLVSASPGQISGVHRGLFVSMFTTTPGTNYMLQLDALQQPFTFITRAGGPWPYWGNPFGMVMDVDNHHVLVPGLIDNSGGNWALGRWNPTTRQVDSPVWAGTRDNNSVNNWSNWTLNSDGNPVTIDNGSVPQRLVEYDRFTSTWKSMPLPAGVAAFSGLSGLEWDAFSGGYIHSGWGMVGVNKAHLYRTAYDGTPTWSVASTTLNISRFGGTLLANGDWISAATAGLQYSVVKAGTTVWTPGPPIAGNALSDVTHDHYAAPGQGFFATVSDGSRAIVHLDPVAATGTTLYTGTAATMPTTAVEVTPLYGRDLCTMRSGRGTWNVHVNPGNGALPGRIYVVVASLIATQPPLVLADGRQIHVGQDPLLFFSAIGSIPPSLTGNIGQLDQNGTGLAQLDFTSVGTALNGVVLHMAAVVIDGQAPLGVGWVCQPHAFVINVLP